MNSDNKETKFKAIDFFCGGGGMTCGLRQAGIDVIAGVDFELFLLPNNTDPGALENLLENIIVPNNQPLTDCWSSYEGELGKVGIPTKEPPTLTIPAKKTKIYAYLETLLGKSKSQKELIKEQERKYENSAHWNLYSEYLVPLKEFISLHL